MTSPNPSQISSYLICLVAEPDVLPFHVHLVHSDPSARRSLLGDTSAGNASTGEAGRLAVRVVGAASLGRGALHCPGVGR